MASAPEVMAAYLDKRVKPLMLATLRAGGDATVKELPSLVYAQLAVEAPAQKTLAAKVTMNFNYRSPEVLAWADEHAAELVTGVTETTRERIAAAIQIGEQEQLAPRDIADFVNQAIGDPARAMMIARTETMRAAIQGQVQAWQQALEHGYLTGREHKIWLTTDPCPICAELEGESVPLGGTFSIGDDPPAHPNCRCSLGMEL